jgi:putative ABC transport system permease protein
MAIGAQESDVRLQFLAEAMLLGLLGGAFGILSGWVTARVLTESFGWPMAISTNTIVVAVAFASGVGLVFGYLPARHAASLDPIEALRAE